MPTFGFLLEWIEEVQNEEDGKTSVYNTEVKLHAEDIFDAIAKFKIIYGDEIQKRSMNVISIGKF